MILTLTNVKHSYIWTRRNLNADYAPRDGCRGIIVGSRLYMLGGWDPSNPNFTAGGWVAGTTNEIWYSDDQGINWTMLLPQDPAAINRWKPRHEFGVCQYGGYVYVVGGDSNSGSYQIDVWRASENDLSTWELRALDWGCGNRVLYSCWARDNKIYIAAGQTIKSLTGENPETFFNDVWMSSNDGISFTQISIVPEISHQNACTAINYQGQTWFVAGGRYKTEFTKHVLSTIDGINFTTHNDAPFDARYYNDCAVVDGKLFMYGGYSNRSQYGEIGGSDPSGLVGWNRADIWFTSNGETWNQYAPTEIPNISAPLSHASTVFGLPNSLIISAGNHLTKEVWQLYRYIKGSPPAIANVTPNIGNSSAAITTDIWGAGFLGATSVTFGGTSASFTIVNDAKITATIGPVFGSPTGYVDLVVVTPNGTSTLTGAYEYIQVTPHISYVDPYTGDPTTSNYVTIIGNNFTGATAVDFNGVAAVSFVVNSSTTIHAYTPIVTTSGFVSVHVTTPEGNATLAYAYLYKTVISSKSLEGVWESERYNYSTGVLSDTSSTGGSGNRDLTSGSLFASRPTVGASLNGYPTLQMNSGSYLESTGFTGNDFFTTSGATFFALVKPTSSGSDLGPGGIGSIQGNAFFLGIDSNDLCLSARDDSLKMTAVGIQYDGTYKSASSLLRRNDWNAVQMTFYSGVMRFRINDGPWNHVSPSPTSLNASALTAKIVTRQTSYGSVAGNVACFGAAKGTSESDLDDILNYWRLKYNIPLIAVTPTIYSIFPDIGANASGQMITLTGSGFTSGAAVTLGGVSCTSVVFVDSHTITAITPATTAGTLSIVLTIGTNTSSLPSAFLALEVGTALSWTLHHAGNISSVAGGSVLGLVDQGPGGFNATDVTLSPPNLVTSDVVYNNKPTLQFPTSSSCLQTATFTNNQPITQFLVGNTSVGASTFYLMDGLSGTMSLAGLSGTTAEMYSSSAFDITTNPSTPAVWTQVYDNASSIISQSSHVEITGAVGTSSPGGLTIGANKSGNLSCQGTIALILQIHGNLTYDQRSTNRNLLGAYYNKSITVPVLLPSAMNLSGWFDTDYAGVPWVSNTSAGTSGSRTLNSSSGLPVPGSAINGHIPLSLNGSSFLSNTGITNYFSASAGSIGVLVNANTLTDGFSNGNVSPQLFGDDFGEFGLHIGGTSNDQVQAYVDSQTAPSGAKQVAVPFAIGQWQFCQMRWNGSLLEVRVNSNAWSSIACGQIYTGGPSVVLGQSYYGRAVNGTIPVAFTSATKLSDADFNSLKAYINARFALSL